MEFLKSLFFCDFEIFDLFELFVFFETLCIFENFT